MVVSIRQAIWSRFPDVTITRAKTLDAQLNDSIAIERFQTMVLFAFGGAALALAMLGIYGVLSCSVEGRRKEIGVRIAVGATRGGICIETLRESATSDDRRPGGGITRRDVGIARGSRVAVWRKRN